MTEKIEIDLKQIFKALIRKSWLIALSAVVLAAVVLMYTVFFVEPMYDAKVTAYVNNGKAGSDGAINSSEYSVALRLVNTYVAILESDNVLEKVIQQENLDVSANDIRKMLTASPIDDTEMFEFIIRCADPKLATQIANAIAKVAPDAILEIMKGSSAAIIDYAKVPSSRSSPNYVKNTLIGEIVGVLVAAVIIILREVMNVRIKNEEDLNMIAPIPVLGVIPDLTLDVRPHAYYSYRAHMPEETKEEEGGAQ